MFANTPVSIEPSSAESSAAAVSIEPSSALPSANALLIQMAAAVAASSLFWWLSAKKAARESGSSAASAPSSPSKLGGKLDGKLDGNSPASAPLPTDAMVDERGAAVGEAGPSAPSAVRATHQRNSGASSMIVSPLSMSLAAKQPSPHPARLGCTSYIISLSVARGNETRALLGTRNCGEKQDSSSSVADPASAKRQRGPRRLAGAGRVRHSAFLVMNFCSFMSAINNNNPAVAQFAR